ncbi:hypothetical protein PsYK624_106210 [Phanerochaete sordida]|uniref:Uncharacterized protein n=1 Tax=Phanerochaete sordida TaxID=48140 RepID=A0A9P3LGD4_9APHY|nr:hypothetical protein PsYK624_106210 [Phanerochaete sordida]
MLASAGGVAYRAAPGTSYGFVFARIDSFRTLILFYVAEIAPGNLRLSLQDGVEGNQRAPEVQ